MTLINNVKIFLIVNYYRIIYHLKRIAMNKQINYIDDIIESFISNSEYQNLEPNARKELKTKLEIEFMDIYHKEILDHLEPFLYEDFYELSKEADFDKIDSFLTVHLHNYKAVCESAYIKFISNLIGYKNSKGNI